MIGFGPLWAAQLIDLFGPIPHILPDWVLTADLLRVFIWYISISFAASLMLRLRFYVSVYSLARHVSEACPSVYRLIHEHWFWCVKDGLLVLVGLYGVLLSMYMALTRLVLPEAHANLEMLANQHPLVVLVCLCFIGTMVTVDTALLVQVGVLDVERVKADLTYAEEWLGGHLNSLLGFLGRWNPIKAYADSKAKESLVWMNEVFRNSVQVMIGQLLVRISTAAFLVACYIFS
jgi:hypothetical protein